MLPVKWTQIKFDTSVYFEGQSDQGVTQLVLKPFSILQT